MGEYTVEQYTQDIRVGFGIRPWWFSAEVESEMIAAGLLEESVLYESAIPPGEVLKVLRKGGASSFEVAALKGLDDLSDAVLFDAEGNPFPYRVVLVEGRAAIGAADGRDVFYNVASEGYNTEDHQPEETLFTQFRQIVGEGIGFKTVGLLGGGAEAFVSVSKPGTETAPLSGMSFVPTIFGHTSWTGRYPLTIGEATTVPLCDNTVSMALGEASASGKAFRVKHTKNSGLKIESAQEALGILTAQAESFAAQADSLAAYAVTDAEWRRVLDALVPVPFDAGRGQTMATSKRAEIDALYTSDPRVADWKGTGLGVLQAFNTWGQHSATVKGGVHRAERNMGNLFSGKIAQGDASTVAALLEVCERELVAA